MKKIFTIFLLILSNTFLFAQEEGEPEDLIEIEAEGRTFQQIADSLFQYLNPRPIPFGVLTNRVYAGDRLSSFSNGDTIRAENLKQTYWDLEQATLPYTGFVPRYAEVNDSLFNQINRGALPIMIIDYNISSIKEDAYDIGALIIGEDGLPREGDSKLSAYETDSCLVAGLAAKQAYANKPYHFTLKHILSNTSYEISQVNIIDLSSQDQWVVLPERETEVIFTETGDRYFKIQVQFNNRETSSFIFFLNVLPSYPMSMDDCDPIHNIIASKIPFKGIGESYATTTWIDYHIYYHYEAGSTTSCEPVLKKPVLILDGFDPLDQRNYDVLYEDYLQNQSQELIAAQLRQKGFDVIIVNFPVLGHNGSSTDIAIPSFVKKEVSPGVLEDVNKEGRDGGADFIERNAMAVVALIQEINAQLVQNNSEEKLVIVGPSMGGQIARYALAYMEKQEDLGEPDMDHNTRLYLSYDSPHDGANIALGHQIGLFFYGETIGNQMAKDNLENKLLSTAAKQMLIEQLDGQNNSAPFRSAYYSNLNNNGLPNSHGYPLKSRNVTITNGSGSGQKYHFEGARVIDAYGKKMTWLFGGIKFFINQTNFLPHYGNTALLFRGRGAVLGFPTILSVSTHSYQVINSNPRGSMDVVPGGNYNVQQELKEGFIPGLVDQDISESNQHWNLKHGMSFIPTISALGFKNPNFNWNNRVDNRNLICNNEIYFDNYFVPETNEQHIADPDNGIYINNTSAKWIMEEIEKGQPDCPIRCKKVQPIDNDLSPLCIEETRVINHNYDLPPLGVEVTWTSETPYALQVVFQNQQMAVVRGLEEMIDAQLKYTIHNPCGTNIVGVITLDVGISQGGLRVYPETPNTIGGTPLVNFAKIENYKPEHNDYYWRYGEGGAWEEAYSEHCPYVFSTQTHFDPNLPRIYLKTVNRCGEFIEQSYPWMQAAPLAGALTLGNTFAYPNPSTGDWNIQFSHLGDIQLLLYDYMGKLVWESMVNDWQTTIPGHEFPTGVYMLKVQSTHEENTIKLMKL